MTREIAINPVDLPYSKELRLAGAACSIATNSHALVQALEKWSTGDAQDAPGFSMQVLVNCERSTALSNPHFRGLHHLVIASFGTANRFVFDLARRNVIASISEDLAGDQLFWNRLLLPIAMGVLGTAVGVIPVHSACLSVGGTGMLIGGASGAGKSTLAVALAQHGFDYISDDWTYLSLRGGRLVAHGMSVPAKLLPDAVRHFPILAEYPIRMALNQELAYELAPENLGGKVQLSCEPELFFFLERTAHDWCQFAFAPISTGEVQQYVECSLERLPDQLTEHWQARTAMINHISGLSCWKLKYGGPPEIAVRGLQEFVTQLRQDVSA